MKSRIVVLFVGAMLLMATNVLAVTFSSNSNNIYVADTPTATLSATADFSFYNNNTLQIVLTNTGGAAETNPDVLLGLFFKVDGVYPPYVTSGSSATASSLVKTDGTIYSTDNDVSDYWAYASALNDIYGQFNAGISGVGLGVFDPGDIIGDSVLNGSNPATQILGQPNGGDYGIVNGFTTPTSVNTNEEPYIDSYLTILLSVDDDFNLDQIISVGFQYGTALAPDVPVPEPSTLLLLGAGIVGFAAYRRKKN